MSRTHRDEDEEKVLLDEGQQVDRYIVKDIVGRGGLAVVYRVEHTQLKSSFALKQLLITSPYIRRRLRREGVVQAKLRHPNLVLVTDMIELPTGPGLVMEFVAGPTLEQLLAGGQQLAVEEVDRIAEGVLAGVAAAHARGLIHRDLKPGNVLLQVDDAGYVPRIMDFGFVKVVAGDEDLDLSVTQPGIKLGTPRYMAPEQATNARGVDASADVYSLGAILYELATGQKAFQHDGLEVEQMERDKLWDRFRPAQELRPDMPERWDRAIQGALRANRESRVSSAARLLALWRGEQDSLPAALPPAGVPDSDTLALTPPPAVAAQPSPAATARRMQLRRGLIGFAVGALLLFGTLLAWRAGTQLQEDVSPATAVSGSSAVPVAPAPVAAAAPESVAPMRRRGGADRRRDSPCSGTVHPRAAPSAGESLPCLASSDAARPACPQNPADGRGEATATQSTSSSPRSQHCRRRAGAAAGKRRPLAPSIFFCGPQSSNFF